MPATRGPGQPFVASGARRAGPTGRALWDATSHLRLLAWLIVLPPLTLGLSDALWLAGVDDDAYDPPTVVTAVRGLSLPTLAAGPIRRREDRAQSAPLPPAHPLRAPPRPQPARALGASLA